MPHIGEARPSLWSTVGPKQLIIGRWVTTCFAVGSPSESSSHVSTRRKTEEPPSRPSGGTEGDSPLGCDEEGTAGGPSGPLHGSSAGITRKHSQTCDTERIDFFFKEQLSGEDKRKGGCHLCVRLVGLLWWALHACVLHRTGGKGAQDLQGSFFPSEWRRRSRSAGRARREPWTVAGW